jgi:energy-converting hydrogenase Eha subunit A
MTRRVIQLALAALVLHLLLIQPNHPAAMTWEALFVFPLELPVILMALIALPPAGWGRVARGVLVAVLMLIAVLKAADYTMFTALGRGFNPVADLSLIEAGLRLATGAIGPVLTMGAVLAALVAVACVGWALWWASGVWARLTAPPLLAG